MKSALFVLLGFIVSSPYAAAQGSWAEKMVEGGLTHDFKSIPRGTQLYHRFKLKNPYAVPLEISTRVGCNCVTATPSAKVLEPRQEGSIDILMDARRFTGVKPVNIFLTVSGPGYLSMATLVVTANSRADIVLNPGQVAFGPVNKGVKSNEQVIDVDYAGQLDWKVSEVVKAPETPLDVTFEEVYRKPGQVGYRVKVVIKPDAPAGSMRHEIFLKTNDPGSPLVPILVEAIVQANITIAPNPVVLGTLHSGESVTKRVIVRAPKPFRVLGVDGAGDGITVDLPTISAQTQIIQVKFAPTKTGSVHQLLKLKTDLDKEAPLSLTVDGAVEP